MTDKYKELREAAEAATPGPWEWSEDRFTGGYAGLYGPNYAPVIALQSMNDGDTGRAWIGTEDYYGDEALTEANAQYIISANPATIRALLAERDALVEALEGIAEWTDRWTSPGHPVSNVARAAIEAATRQEKTDD